MRCSKARELFFGSCDGTIDEARKMKLQEHLDRCPACAAFATEMEACLGALKGLPECSPSDNFEWNLKRRILQERSRAIRQGYGSYLRDVRWGTKFATGAAAAIVAVLVGAWLLMDGRAVRSGGGLAVNSSGERMRPETSVTRIESPDRFLPSGSAEMRMVSEGSRLSTYGGSVERPLAFQSAAAAREDSLMRENEYLRWYLQRVERENLILRQYLHRAQGRR